MALIENTDYVFCPKTTYLGSGGMGTSCLVGTKNLLLCLPVELFEVDVLSAYTEKTTTTYSIGGASPAEAIQIMAADQDDLQEFEQMLVSLADECEDSILVRLDEIKRLKVKSSLLSKGVYYSGRETGPGWKALGLGKKPLALAFAEFYRDHPRIVA